MNSRWQCFTPHSKRPQIQYKNCPPPRWGFVLSVLFPLQTTSTCLTSIHAQVFWRGQTTEVTFYIGESIQSPSGTDYLLNHSKTTHSICCKERNGKISFSFSFPHCCTSEGQCQQKAILHRCIRAPLHVKVQSSGTQKCLFFHIKKQNLYMLWTWLYSFGNKIPWLVSYTYYWSSFQIFMSLSCHLWYVASLITQARSV